MAGCAQQIGNVLSNGKVGSARPLPFDRTPENGGPPATADLARAAIPVGTTIVIRLQSPMSSADARAGEVFQGVLDQPVLLTGQTLVPSGALVEGKILAAKPGDSHEPGYLRLTLCSMVVDNRTLNIHTSSLFAKRSSSGHGRTATPNLSQPVLQEIASQSNLENAGHAQLDIKFSTARRLTFRLLDPVALSN